MSKNKHSLNDLIKRSQIDQNRKKVNHIKLA
jgi:hypothetical protein